MLVGDIKPNKKQILKAILFNWEKALIWEFFEIGHISREVTPLLKIKTVPYKA